MPEPSDACRRVGFIGCVKQESARPAAAKDLYTSTLFVGRRRYVERTCDEWWVLSALYGLVHPDDLLDPYDCALRNSSRRERRSWAALVLAAIEKRVAVQSGDVVELHAGAEYRDYGLADGLATCGARIVNPTAGLGIGLQLAFYKEFKR